MAVIEDVAVVRKAIEGSATFPEAAKVLLSGLPDSIAGTSGLLLLAALDDAQVTTTTTITDLATAADAAQSELATATASLQETEAAAEAAAEELRQRVEALSAAQQVLEESEQLHKVTEEESEQQVQEWAEIREEHLRTASIVEGSLQKLVAGRWEDSEAMQASVQEVQGELERARVEKALIAGSGVALSCPPDTRAPFDMLIVEEVTKTLNSGLASLQTRVDEIAPLEKDIKAERLGSWAIVDCAREELDNAVAAESAAKRGQKRSHEELTKAKRVVSRLQHSLAELTESRTAKEQELSDIEAAVAAAKRLKTAPTMPVEEAPVPEAVACEAPPKVDVVETEAAGIAGGMAVMGA